ncbi:hypothetical protein GCM10010470_43500 [Saccharopolyspora taberi]|uniref:Uncharacterized protein n=1 Tax=Saccharopolyspora taberi TaxID=60895 RepID=A0ABN3VGQ3_9PSEU
MRCPEVRVDPRLVHLGDELARDVRVPTGEVVALRDVVAEVVELDVPLLVGHVVLAPRREPDRLPVAAPQRLGDVAEPPGVLGVRARGDSRFAAVEVERLLAGDRVAGGQRLAQGDPVQVGGDCRTGEVGERGQQVPERPELVGDRARGLRQQLRRPREQWRPDSTFVEVALVAAQRTAAAEALRVERRPSLFVRAVVAGEQHDGVLVEPVFPEGFQESADVAVEPGDLGRVRPVALRPRAVRVRLVGGHVLRRVREVRGVEE